MFYAVPSTNPIPLIAPQCYIILKWCFVASTWHLCFKILTQVWLCEKSSQVDIWSIFGCTYSITLSTLCSLVFGQYANGVSDSWEALINWTTQPAREDLLHPTCWQWSLLKIILLGKLDENAFLDAIASPGSYPSPVSQSQFQLIRFLCFQPVLGIFGHW